VTRDQALAFIEVSVGSPKVRAHLGAILGYGRVPTLKDFSSHDSDSIDWCDEIIGYLEEVAGVLRELQKNRERQLEVPEEAPRARKAKVAGE